LINQLYIKHMTKISPLVKFFINLAKFQAIVSRRFDSRLGGLGFSEFMILFYLSQAEDEKLRRIDLAEKIGLTASGVTRILYPMEKVGLIKREINKDDARVSYVIMAPGGRTRLSEALERAELTAEEILPRDKISDIEKLSELLG
jgi:DNA-binding MarR family transcriptional regulator